jgi:hypothetical protein
VRRELYNSANVLLFSMQAAKSSGSVSALIQPIFSLWPPKSRTHILFDDLKLKTYKNKRILT